MTLPETEQGAHADATDDVPPSHAADDLAWVRRHFGWFVLAFAALFFIAPRVSPLDGLHLNIFERFSEWTLGKLEHLFKDYGYYVVAFGVFAENSMFLGFLVPGTIILILAGLSAENGSINLPLVMAVAVAATIAGDTMSYYVGRLGWAKALSRGRFSSTFERVRGEMESNSTWIILAYHFAGYSRAVGPPAAGLFRIPYRKWAPLDYLGGTVWAITYVLVGVVLGAFGVEFGDTKAMVRLLEVLFLVLLVVALASTFVRSSRRARRATLPPAAAGGSGAPAAVAMPTPDER